MMDRIKFTYENLPDFMKENLNQNTMSLLKFNNESLIMTRGMSRDAARGLTLTSCIVDQLHNIPWSLATEFSEAILPCIYNGQIVFASSDEKNNIFPEESFIYKIIKDENWIKSPFIKRGELGEIPSDE